jgi:hypothetical protein
MRTESQNKRIEKDLKRGKKITPIMALKRYKCFRLSGRIFELRERGLNIVSRMIDKGDVRVAEYSLKK